MFNATRSEMKKARAGADRWYNQMAKMPDGSIEGYMQRWDMTKQTPTDLRLPLAIITTITMILNRTR